MSSRVRGDTIQLVTLVSLLLIFLVCFRLYLTDMRFFRFAIPYVPWSEIANLATIVAMLFLAYQILGEKKARQLQASAQIIEIMGRQPVRNARKLIYELEREERLPKTDGEIEAADLVKAGFNQMGLLVRKKLFPKELAFELYSDTAIRCWKALEDYIKELRKKREDDHYMNNFEWFQRESRKWRKKKGLRVEQVIYAHAES